MKSIKLTQKCWSALLKELHLQYPKSVLAIRSRMREKLGFVSRDHQWYDPKAGHYRTDIVLDFYSENKRTMFLMKYSEFINDK